jgi:hypothetical protein
MPVPTASVSISTPDFLSHYYERAHGPFRNLSQIPLADAERILAHIRQRGDVFASQRAQDYLSIRRDLEDQVRRKFVAKGGIPILERPHYMILGASPWLCEWYQDGREICIPLARFAPAILSFTYGDTFPAMRFPDGKPYRGQVYTLEELPDLIREFGLPQEWNPDGEFGPDRYIEAQVWDDAPIQNAIEQLSASDEV